MEIIRPSACILWCTPDPVVAIERAARTCYKSEDKITETSAAKMVAALLKSGHDAMIEHASCSVLVTTDRGISHEFVRHRIASFAQESTRYVKYAKGIRVIPPIGLNDCAYAQFVRAMMNAETGYNDMLACGCTPQQARDVLPTCVACDMVITTNFREWRHFFKQRKIGTTGKPHPKMQELATMIHDVMLPVAGPLIADL